MMNTPIQHRRRESDHPRRRLEDAPAHQRLLKIVMIGAVVGIMTVLIASIELRYRDSARAADVSDLRELTEQVTEMAEDSAADTRAHRIRTEELLARLCQILVSAHEGVSPADCLQPLVHPTDPGLPPDIPLPPS